MKGFPLLFVIAITLTAAEPVKLASLTTIGGSTYQDVTITDKLTDGIKIMHASGFAKIPAEQLPPEIVTQLGGFDAAAIEKFRKEEAAKAESRKRSYLDQKQAEAAEKAMWEPLPTMIAKLAANTTTPEIKQRLEFYRLMLKALQSEARPLLDQGAMTPENAKEWVRAALKGEPSEGMSLNLVIGICGTPADISRSNGLVRTVIFRYADRSSIYAYFDKDGYLDSWSD